MTDAAADGTTPTEGDGNVLTRTKDGATGRWRRWQDEHQWLRHVVDAWALLQRHHGSQYAAAITYFSFLALFPLLLLGVAVTGFVLSSHPELQQSLFDKIAEQVPGSFGTTLSDAVHTAIEKRTSVGIVGLVGVLLTGLGWIGNLREPIDAVWGVARAKKSFLGERLSNLLVLAGLGLGLLVSIGLTVVGTSVTGQIVRAVGLDGVPGTTVLLKVVGIGIAVVGDAVIFWWLLIRLPDADVEKKVALRGALLAAVGFELLKIVGSFTIAHTANSTTAGPFAGIVAILVWIQLVCRWMLFCCAWIATLNAARRMANSVPVVPVPVDEVHGEVVAGGPSPAAVGATLVGAGALAGALATWAVTRPHRG